MEELYEEHVSGLHTASRICLLIERFASDICVRVREYLKFNCCLMQILVFAVLLFRCIAKVAVVIPVRS